MCSKVRLVVVILLLVIPNIVSKSHHHKQGDDPITTNQSNRAIQIDVSTDEPSESFGGSLGITFNGYTTPIDVSTSFSLYDDAACKTVRRAESIIKIFVLFVDAALPEVVYKY